MLAFHWPGPGWREIKCVQFGPPFQCINDDCRERGFPKNCQRFGSAWALYDDCSGRTSEGRLWGHERHFHLCLHDLRAIPKPFITIRRFGAPRGGDEGPTTLYSFFLVFDFGVVVHRNKDKYMDICMATTWERPQVGKSYIFAHTHSLSLSL